MNTVFFYDALHSRWARLAGNPIFPIIPILLPPELLLFHLLLL